MRLEGKVAIVTGAGRGLGRGIARKLAQEGAKVVIADVTPADDAVKELLDAGHEACDFSVDVSDQEQMAALVAFAIKKYGTLDIMVNNAGINRDGMLHKMPRENWDKVIAIDLTGTFFGTQEAIKYMRTKNYGRVINISSGSWLGNIGQLCGGKGRRSRSHKDRRPRKCAQGHHLQRYLPRLHRDRHDTQAQGSQRWRSVGQHGTAHTHGIRR